MSNPALSISSNPVGMKVLVIESCDNLPFETLGPVGVLPAEVSDVDVHTVLDRSK